MVAPAVLLSERRRWLTGEAYVEIMLGLDVGGTKVAVGAVTRGGALREPPLVHASGTVDAEDLLASVVAAVRDGLATAAERGDTVSGVGLACAGTVDLTRGVVVESPNLPLVDFPLSERAAAALGMPVVLDNDASAAVLAEARVGVAAGLRHVVMLTLGTGVGGGLYLDDHVYRGASGSAAELGHVVVHAGGKRCRCGNRGCLEAYTSGTAFGLTATRLVARALRESDPRLLPEMLDLYERGELTGEAAGDLAVHGDPLAVVAVREVAWWLGMGLVSMANIFNPEMIVVGGGFGTLGELLLAPAREVLLEHGLSPNREIARVEPAALGNDAGALGAGLVAWEELGPTS